jgi:hypothetical protein
LQNFRKNTAKKIMDAQWRQPTPKPSNRPTYQTLYSTLNRRQNPDIATENGVSGHRRGQNQNKQCAQGLKTV